MVSKLESSVAVTGCKVWEHFGLSSSMKNICFQSSFFYLKVPKKFRRELKQTGKFIFYITIHFTTMYHPCLWSPQMTNVEGKKLKVGCHLAFSTYPTGENRWEIQRKVLKILKLVKFFKIKFGWIPPQHFLLFH